MPFTMLLMLFCWPAPARRYALLMRGVDMLRAICCALFYITPAAASPPRRADATIYCYHAVDDMLRARAKN